MAFKKVTIEVDADQAVNGDFMGIKYAGVPWGTLAGIAVKYHDDVPGTADLAVVNCFPLVEGAVTPLEHTFKQLLVRENNNENMPLYPIYEEARDMTGVAAVDGLWVEPPVGGTVGVTISECTELAKAVTVTLLIRIS
jgi:hypothetical protein